MSGGPCLDVLFIGDDYGSGDLSTFAGDVQAHSQLLLATAPYSSNLDRINIRRVDSTEDLGCYYNCEGIERLICCNPTKVALAAASSGVPYDEIIVVVNNNEYGGAGYPTVGGGDPSGFAVAYRVHPYWGPYVTVHEFGHSFGGLMDEYGYGTTGSSWAPNCKTAGCSSWSGMAGTGCHAECSYSNLYRSTPEGCLMRTLTPTGGYIHCPVCRRAIESILGCQDRSCVSSDPCLKNGVCNNDTGGVCRHEPVANGTTCNDGNACTQTDTCQTGVCTGANPIACAAPDQCKEQGVCNTATGACSYASKPNSTPCNDGNACTQTDTCQTGVCTGASPVACAAPDQCKEQGVCNTATGACSYASKPNSTPCNDGNACTQTDTCQTGVCTGASPVACAAPDACQEQGICNPGTGTCTNDPRPDNAPCNDGNACTFDDLCRDGSCMGTPAACLPHFCDMSVACDGTGGCLRVRKAFGEPCDDGDPCTDDDFCDDDHICTGSPSPACEQPDPDPETRPETPPEQIPDEAPEPVPEYAEEGESDIPDAPQITEENEPLPEALEIVEQAEPLPDTPDHSEDHVSIPDSQSSKDAFESADLSKPSDIPGGDTNSHDSWTFRDSWSSSDLHSTDVPSVAKPRASGGCSRTGGNPSGGLPIVVLVVLMLFVRKTAVRRTPN
jgi:hypothetical protein